MHLYSSELGNFPSHHSEPPCINFPLLFPGKFEDCLQMALGLSGRGRKIFASLEQKLPWSLLSSRKWIKYASECGTAAADTYTPNPGCVGRCHFPQVISEYTEPEGPPGLDHPQSFKEQTLPS